MTAYGLYVPKELKDLEKVMKYFPQLSGGTINETTDDLPVSDAVFTDTFISDEKLFFLKLQTILQSLADTASSQSFSYVHMIGGLSQEIKALKDKVEALLKCGEAITVEINFLQSKRLSSPITALIEPDGEGFIARSPDLPSYGYGEDRIEAIGMLKDEVESLYEDLMEDDNFSEDYLKIKHFLIERIVD